MSEISRSRREDSWGGSRVGHRSEKTSATRQEKPGTTSSPLSSSACAQVGGAAAGAENVDRPGGRVNDPQEGTPAPEELYHLFVDFLRTVIGGDDLEGEVGGDLAVTAEWLLVRQSASRDEGAGRLPNARWVGGENLVAAFGIDDVPQGVGNDMRLEQVHKLAHRVRRPPSPSASPSTGRRSARIPAGPPTACLPACQPVPRRQDLD